MGYDILSLLHGILYKNSKGLATLSSFLIASPVVILYVPLLNIIFKSEVNSFKILDTVNVDFIHPEIHDEQSLHITSLKNDPLK